VSVRVADIRGMLRAIEAIVKDVLVHSEQRLRELVVTGLVVEALRRELVNRLSSLRIYDEPVISIDAFYSTRAPGSPRLPDVKIWIVLPKHRVTCLATYNAEMVHLMASRSDVYAVIRRNEESDIAVECWSKNQL